MQAQRPGFDPRDPHETRREPTPQSTHTHTSNTITFLIELFSQAGLELIVQLYRTGTMEGRGYMFNGLFGFIRV